MKVTVEFDRLDEVERESKRRIEQVLRDGALEVQAMSQSLAPVDTGRLRASISTRDTGPLSYEVYTNILYAEYQEYGTRHQAGKPFMRPSYERHRQGITQRLSNALSTL